MKWLKKLHMSLLIVSVMVLTTALPAFAADEEYTYTVKLYAGNQGELTGKGISVSGGSGANIAYDKDRAVVTGLKYGDTVYINFQDAASVTDEHYYVKGVRRSGRDNSEATESTFSVGSDRDYVIAYGISGDMVAYTVNYVDEDGNALLDSDTYYGNPGERQYVSSRYVDGYQPQAYNLVKTLVQNEAENVFDFIYTPIPEGTAPAPVDTTPADAAPAAPAAPAAAAPAAAAPAAGEDEGGDVGGDQTTLPDENTPQGVQDLDNVEDEQTPLGQQDLEADRPGTVVSYLPVYIGIGAAALGALAIMAVYLKKRRKAAVPVSTGQIADEITDMHDSRK